jgi:cytochrome c-type biogenesis protein CcmH/NrfG
MRSSSVLWALAGVLAGIAASGAYHSFRGGHPVPSVPHAAAGAGNANALRADHPQAAEAGGAQKAQSLEVSVQRLADRIAAQGGSDSDWTLLAQSYDFLGDAEAAKKARLHVLPARTDMQAILPWLDGNR